jgi:hypothetical protein
VKWFSEQRQREYDQSEKKGTLREVKKQKSGNERAKEPFEQIHCVVMMVER